jgi:hypothetical protein
MPVYFTPEPITVVNPRLLGTLLHRAKLLVQSVHLGIEESKSESDVIHVGFIEDG